MSNQGQVKGHSQAFSHFGLSGLLDRLQIDHTHPQCWVNVHGGYCMSTKGMVMVRSQKITKHKHAVQHVSCVILHADIDGDSHLTIWPLSPNHHHLTVWRHPPDFWRTADQVQVEGQIFKSIFLHKKHVCLCQNFLGIPNMQLVFVICNDVIYNVIWPAQGLPG